MSTAPFRGLDPFELRRTVADPKRAETDRGEAEAELDRRGKLDPEARRELDETTMAGVSEGLIKAARAVGASMALGSRGVQDLIEANEAMTRARMLLGCSQGALRDTFERVGLTSDAFLILCQTWTPSTWSVDHQDPEKWIPGSIRDDWSVRTDCLLERGDHRGPWIAKALADGEPLSVISLYYWGPNAFNAVVHEISW